MIPMFRDDGYLPEGIHLATEAEITARFGTSTPHRMELAGRLRHWIALSRGINARRLLVDGSFVTAKQTPRDVDAVVWLGDDYASQLTQGNLAAYDLMKIVLSRKPPDIHAVDSRMHWDDWVDFFSSLPDHSGKRKGIVEVIL